MMKRLLIPCFILALSAANPAYAVCVSVSKANVRSGPGTWYEKLWDVYKYTPLQKVGVSVSGDWYAARDVDGDIVWIKKGLVTNGYGCTVVKTHQVNVRTGPGTSRPLSPLSPAIHYDTFRVMEKRGGWIKVKDGKGNTGWIEKSYLWTQ